MKDFVITFVKLTISQKHNFVLYNALLYSNLLFTLNNRIIPQIFTNFHTQYHSISMHKKRPNIWQKSDVWPFPALNLRSDFHAIAERECHPAIRIDRCIPHKTVEQLPVEIHRQLIRLDKPRKEAAKNGAVLRLPFLKILFVGIRKGSLQQSITECATVT